MDLLNELFRIRVLVAFYRRVVNDLAKIGIEKMGESGLFWGDGPVNKNLLQEANDNLVRFQRIYN